MKALARYQIILLGEQRHIRCEQLAQGCCPNNATAGVELATSRSRVQRPTATLPSHLAVCVKAPSKEIYSKSTIFEFLWMVVALLLSVAYSRIYFENRHFRPVYSDCTPLAKTPSNISAIHWRQRLYDRHGVTVTFDTSTAVYALCHAVNIFKPILKQPRLVLSP